MLLVLKELQDGLRDKDIKWIGMINVR